MKQEYVHIEILIEQFFDGMTTREEERELYAFFQLAGDDLPEHLVAYKEVFTWFDTGIDDEIAEKAPVYPFPSMEEDEKAEERKPRKVWMRWAVVAASILLAVAFYSVYTMKQADNELLEGYIIRNGVKITDMDVIRSELEATVQTAVMQEVKAEQLFRQLHASNDAFMTAEEQMQQQYCQIISQFPDPLIREEVEKMLGVKCNDYMDND